MESTHQHVVARFVSPDEHRIAQLILQEGRYAESTETESITMHVAPHATVDLTRVW